MDEPPPRTAATSLCDSSPLAVSLCDSSPLAVSLCDSSPLLWRVEDLRSMRAQGLVGALLGALPRTPRQNVRLGRPLLLLPEEERLLTERHVGPPTATPADNQDGRVELQVQQYQEAQQRSYEEQSVLALEDRKSALLRAMTSSPTESGDESLRCRLAALESSFSFPRSAMAVQLSYHGQGPTALPSIKVPPGDPLRFHAHFIAVCVSLDESLSLLDVLAVSRLGSNVKKTVLLCSPGTDGRVAYTSLQWSGMV
ncbi:hypothetical protein PFLUV_G00016380 [Perca fluviatilis]|uniref:tRNA-intron lyase n=1 Tax=Perca fluviatilis TaxID=8168 RepID=A0A6A5FR37_PERFL|nr:hypothetical protein PFLUV_G00016380 [Perca fluviatilis]